MSKQPKKQQQQPLPPANQQWAHSVCSVKDLRAALDDTNVTAIETDILLGQYTGGEECVVSSFQPILAHPPDTMSDLSFQKFLDMVLTKEGKLQKHIKLDFKEYHRVVPECLTALSLSLLSCGCLDGDNDKTIFLNADILPGPGRSEATIPADLFLSACCRDGVLNSRAPLALSLGWTVDVCSVFGYTAAQVQELCTIILQSHHHNFFLLTANSNIVLTANARLLVKNMTVFKDALNDLPDTCQLLVWTGSGEPPISTRKRDAIQNYFCSYNQSARVGFDVQTTTVWNGLLYDAIMFVLGIKNLLLTWLYSTWMFASPNSTTVRSIPEESPTAKPKQT